MPKNDKPEFEEPPRILKFEFPEIMEVEAVLIKGKDGKIKLRSTEELKKKKEAKT